MSFSLSAIKEAVAARFQRNKQRVIGLEAEVKSLKADVATEKKAKREAHSDRRDAERKVSTYEKTLADIKVMAEDDLEQADPAPDPADAPDAPAGDAAGGVSPETDPAVMAVATPDVA